MAKNTKIPRHIKKLIKKYENDPTFLWCWWYKDDSGDYGFVFLNKFLNVKGIMEEVEDDWITFGDNGYFEENDCIGYYFTKIGKYYL